MNNLMLSGKKYKNKNGTTNSISPCFLISSLNNSVALYVFPFLGLPFTITIFNKIQYTSVENAVFLAEQIRKTLSEKEIPTVGRGTVSLGVAGYIPGDTVDSLVNKADNMMYEAKSAGRNCVRYISF